LKIKGKTPMTHQNSLVTDASHPSSDIEIGKIAVKKPIDESWCNGQCVIRAVSAEIRFIISRRAPAAFQRRAAAAAQR